MLLEGSNDGETWFVVNGTDDSDAIQTVRDGCVAAKPTPEPTPEPTPSPTGEPTPAPTVDIVADSTRAGVGGGRGEREFVR